MTYISQFKPHGCRNWRDLGEHKKRSHAMNDFGNLERSRAKRVRILELPLSPHSIAEAFMWNPKVIFEGVFK
jgi:hypothetical protein